MLQIETRRKRKPKQLFGKATSAVQQAWEAVPEHWKKMLCAPVVIVIFEGKLTSIADPEIQSRVQKKPQNLTGVIGNLIPARSWDETPGCYLSDARRVYLKIDEGVEGDAYYFQSYFLATIAAALWDDNEAFFFELCHPAFVRHLNLEGWIPSRESVAAANPSVKPERLEEFYTRIRKDACRRLFSRVASLFWFNPRYLEKKWYSIAPFMGKLDHRLKCAAPAHPE